ncbi:type II secretion system protein [Candidatus Gracilibacteria bacterium 28_42_T64]|nr:type II secretion system protein [Candidatus Gracilibacteria bacterium 28_42_T64]
MENMKSKKAFTLVELIVVITIIAILGTIAFISLQGYSSLARDSVRISDINNIRTSLELFSVKTGKYPIPSNGMAITYSGGLVWTQGTVGNSVTTNISQLSNTPIDPILNTEYVYSVTSSQKEYEIGSVLEQGNITQNAPLNSANAVGDLLAYITGTYNAISIQTSTGGTTFILAMPSIIGSDISNPDIIEIIKKLGLAFNGYANLPSDGVTSRLTGTGQFSFGLTGKDILVYAGVSETFLDDFEDITNQIILAANLQNVYSGSDLINDVVYQGLLTMNTGSDEEVSNLIGHIINDSFGGDVDIILPDENQATVSSITLANTGFVNTVWDAVISTSMCGETTTSVVYTFPWITQAQYTVSGYRDLDTDCNQINNGFLLLNNADPGYFTCRTNCNTNDFNRTYVINNQATVLRYDETAGTITITEALNSGVTKTTVMTPR